MNEVIAQSDGSRPGLKPGATVTGLPRLFSCGRFDAERSVAYHTHPGTELVLVTRGRCAVSLQEDTTLEGETGTLFVLPREVPHSQDSVGGRTATTYVAFDAYPYHFDESPRTISTRAEPNLALWLENLVELAGRSPPSRATGGLLVALLERINELEAQETARAILHPRLAQAVQLLEEDLARAWSVASLARAVHLSASHLTALFRRRFGCGPLRYQIRLRMDRARALLLSPYPTVREVARACGYEDENYFTRHFRKFTGQPPRAWRGRKD